MIIVMNVLLLNGSPAVVSHTATTLEFIASLFREHKCFSEVVDLKTFGLPINDPVHHSDAMQSPKDKVREFAQKVKDSDIIVLGTPLYHGSYSGLLKLH
jgi:NAD(P)H-dependent FMN reductase